MVENNNLNMKINDISNALTNENGSNKIDDMVNTIKKLSENVERLNASFENLQSIVKDHDEILKNKNVIDTYAEVLLRKINMLKDLIKKYLSPSEVEFSIDIIQVEAAEEMIKKNGSIPIAKIKELNNMYQRYLKK